MALHKFTPGGCRQDCDTSGCCLSGTCTNGVSYLEYTLTVYRNGVLQATYMLPHNAAESVNTSCAFVSPSAGTGICGETDGWGLLSIYESFGSTRYSVAVYSTDPLAANPQLQLHDVAHEIGPAPQDCTQTLTGTFAIFNAACNGYTWTYRIEPSGALCTAAATNSCCPCEPCRLLRDDFNRAAGTDLGANWDEEAGSWTIIPHSFASVDSANALLLSASAAPQVGVQVEVFARGYSDGDILRLVACYQDADDYVFAEWKVGSAGYLRLYRRSGGSNTLIDEVTPIVTATNRVQRWTLCVQSDGAFASTTLYSNPSGLDFEEVAAGIIATAAAGKYGLASGATVGAHVDFTRFALNSTAEGCERCTVTCEMCDPNATDLIVDLGSAIHNAGTCMGLVPSALYPCDVPAGSYTLSPGPIPHWLDSANSTMELLYGTSCFTLRHCEWLYRDSGCKFYIYLRIGADRDASMNPTVRITVYFILADEASVTTCNWHAYSVEIDAPETTIDCTAGWTLTRCDTFPPFSGQPTPPATIDVYPA